MADVRTVLVDRRAEPMNADKSVASELYDERYYLTCVEGWECFQESGGLEMPLRLKKAVDMANIAAGPCRVLDIGCGRGEVCFYVGVHGAQSVGLDYSAAAVGIAARALSKFPRAVQLRTLFLQGNSKSLPLATETFDVIFMLDIVEHLYPDELRVTLCEARRVLKKGGLLIIHTSPNLWYNTYILPLYTRWMRYLMYHPVKRLLNREITVQDRTQEEMVLHVNEQSPWGLRRTLIDAGFQPYNLNVRTTILPGAMKDYLTRKEWYQVFAGLLISAWPLCLIWPLSLLLKRNIWVVGVKE